MWRLGSRWLTAEAVYWAGGAYGAMLPNPVATSHM